MCRRNLWNVVLIVGLVCSTPHDLPRAPSLHLSVYCAHWDFINASLLRRSLSSSSVSFRFLFCSSPVSLLVLFYVVLLVHLLFLFCSSSNPLLFLLCSSCVSLCLLDMFASPLFLFYFALLRVFFCSSSITLHIFYLAPTTTL